jgi:hypothetical protein
MQSNPDLLLRLAREDANDHIREAQRHHLVRAARAACRGWWARLWGRPAGPTDVHAPRTLERACG